MANPEYIRVAKTGAVYRWTPMLAKRKDVVAVELKDYVEFLHREGLSKEQIAKNLGKRAAAFLDPPEAIPTGPKTRKPRKPTKTSEKPKTVVSNEEAPNTLEELLGDATDLLGRNESGEGDSAG